MNMEGMLNKLKFTVTNAASNAVSNAVGFASQVSNYLPGNPVTREYEATEHIASAGRGLMWKIYKGYKKSTKQEAAIFVLEKRELDKWEKQERDQMLDKMRKGVSQLTRLRHPQVLTVQHPLEESRDTLAFATEPVLASLANLLGNSANMPTPVPLNVKDFKFYDIEIKYGLKQLSEGLSFLHNSVKIVHRALSPETVIVNHEGAWKIFGFDFCVANESPPEEPPMWPFEQYESTHHEFSQPDLDYMGPEYALSHTLDISTDMFSLGVITYALFNEGKPVFQNYQDFSIFKRNSCTLKTPAKVHLRNVPEGLKGQTQLLLHATQQLRPDALQFSSISYFEDVGVKTLNYLDQLFQWDNIQKSQFYKSLPQILPHLPHRVSLLRVIPCLNKECVNPTMIPFVLPAILLVAEKATKEEFIKYILPHMKPIMKIGEPIQVLLLMMQKMELLLSKTPAEDIRSDVLPLLYRAIECDTQQIQELCLTVIPTCVSLVEQSTLKNALLPRIKKLCVGTGYLSVRVNCLVCIGKIIEYFDKWVVIDEVFPFFNEIPSKEAPVIMAIVGICKIALYHKKLGISKEILATKILPFLFPLSIENSLSPTQHRSIMKLIKDMIERVETEHITKLEHLESIRKEQQTLSLSMPTSITENSSSQSNSTGSRENVDHLFDNLGINSKPSATSSNSRIGSHSVNENRRLAEQRIIEGSKQQTPLIPSPSISSPTKSAPSTQTALFMNSNLNNLSNNSKSPTQICSNSMIGASNSMTSPTSSNTIFNLRNPNVGMGSMAPNTRIGSIPHSTGVGSLNSSAGILSNMGVNSMVSPTGTSSMFNNSIASGPIFNRVNTMNNSNATSFQSHFNSVTPLNSASNVRTFNVPQVRGNFGTLQNAMQSSDIYSKNQNAANNYKPLSNSDINDLLS